MKTRLFLLVLGFLALQEVCFAQGSKPAQSAPNPGPTTTPGDPTKYLNRDWEQAYDKGRTGDHLRGIVTLAEGALPWDPIPVIVTCDGKARFTTKTDAQGVFVITRVEPIGSTTIVGTQKALIMQLVGCAVSAVLPGFDSSQLTIANRDVLSNPNIGTITLTREEGSGGTAVSSTTTSAPKSAKKSFEKARSEWLENKPDRAQRELQKAVDIYPQFAAAWYQLGKIQSTSNIPAALNSFSKAVAADPKFALPYEQMAVLSAKAQKWQELVEETNRALELNPRGTLDLWYYHSLGNYQTNKLDVAEASATKSLSMDPLHMQPDTEQLLAVILVAKHDVPAALEHLRNCLTYFPSGPNYDLVKWQIAELESSASVGKNAQDTPDNFGAKKQLEVLSAPAEPDPSEHLSLDFGPKNRGKAGLAPALPESRWLPPDVDELAPAVEPGSTCNLEEVLKKVGQRIQEFVENVERFTATESLLQETINKSGEVAGREERKYDYTVSIKEIRPGMLYVDEYLSNATAPADFPGGITTKGLPALLLIFHPYDSGAFSMRCEGLVSIKGQQMWQIYFRQRSDKPNSTRSYSFGANRPSYPVGLKGRAWFTADTYQIVRLQTDLIDAIPEIRLTADHTVVEYGPVHFSRGGVDMWVPQTAELYSDLKGRRVHQRMNFGNYLLFAVEEKQKISAPKTNP